MQDLSSIFFYFFLNIGANVNLVSSNGHTALGRAAEIGNSAIVRLLLQADQLEVKNKNKSKDVKTSKQSSSSLKSSLLPFSSEISSKDQSVISRKLCTSKKEMKNSDSCDNCTCVHNKDYNSCKSFNPSESKQTNSFSYFNGTCDDCNICKVQCATVNQVSQSLNVCDCSLSISNDCNCKHTCVSNFSQLGNIPGNSHNVCSSPEYSTSSVSGLDDMEYSSASESSLFSTSNNTSSLQFEKKGAKPKITSVKNECMIFSNFIDKGQTMCSFYLDSDQLSDDAESLLEFNTKETSETEATKLDLSPGYFSISNSFLEALLPSDEQFWEYTDSNSSNSDLDMTAMGSGLDINYLDTSNDCQQCKQRNSKISEWIMPRNGIKDESDSSVQFNVHRKTVKLKRKNCKKSSNVSDSIFLSTKKVCSQYINSSENQACLEQPSYVMNSSSELFTENCNTCWHSNDIKLSKIECNKPPIYNCLHSTGVIDTNRQNPKLLNVKSKSADSSLSVNVSNLPNVGYFVMEYKENIEKRTRELIM